MADASNTTAEMLERGTAGVKKKDSRLLLGSVIALGDGAHVQIQRQPHQKGAWSTVLLTRLGAILVLSAESAVDDVDDTLKRDRCFCYVRCKDSFTRPGRCWLKYACLLISRQGRIKGQDN